ncbi:MAG: hypothetical protein M0R46_14520 [Candidatus Muirbacterium halophilum]|nr:hypothetical protein [Candidatus Muirbacterium halophilum]
MDKKLLDGLNNLSMALENIANILKDKNNDSNDSSATSKALTSGNFITEISEINIGVKSIQKDTKAILANQETIINMGKVSNDKSKTEDVEKIGANKNTQKNLKDGLGVIFLMASAVLALGVAFNLIGNVNFGAVMSLSVAILLLSGSFAIVHTTLKKSGFDGTKDTKNYLLSILAISTGIMVSSWILSLVYPLTFSKFFTVTFLAATFALIAPSIGKFVEVFSKLSTKELIKSVIALPLILPAIALGIAASSWVLQTVTPISLAQFLTTIGIMASFLVISFGIKKLIGAFDHIGIRALMLAKNYLPLILPAIALSIAASSWILQGVVPVSFDQLITTILIGGAFTVLSFGMKQLLNSFKNISPSDALKSSMIMPIVLVAMSLSILLSSHILSGVADITLEMMLSIMGFGLALGVVSLALIPAFRLMGKISIKDIILGTLSVVLIASAITISSHILSKGKYDKYPSLRWATGVGLSILAFSASVIGIGLLIAATGGVGAVALLAGVLFMPLVATSIVATSYILSKGVYDKYPPLAWSTSVALSLAAFSVGVVSLGALALTGIGALAMIAGVKAVKYVAQAIVDSSYILGKGKYVGGPTESWSKGIALALVAFTPIFKTLADNASIFKRSISINDMKDAIISISQSIVEAAIFFNKPEARVAYTGGPTKQWVDGVGGAITAFSSVFEVLVSNTTWYRSGSKVISNIKSAIIATTEGIVDTAKIFAKTSGLWNIYPPQSWSNNISNAINSFMDLYSNIKDKLSFWDSDADIVSTIVSRMSKTASIISKNYKYFANSIDPNFISNISKNVLDYTSLLKTVNNSNNFGVDTLLGVDPIQNIAKGMIKIAKAYDKLANSIKNFGSSMNSLDPTRIDSFARLTGNIALLSALDANMFSNMLTVLDSKSSVFVDMLKAQNEIFIANQSTVKVGSSVITGVSNKTTNVETELDKLDKIITLLTSVNGNVGNINKFLHDPKIENKEIGGNAEIGR